MKRISTKLFIVMLGLFLACPVFAGSSNPTEELNLLRSKMACLTDKKSTEYIKLKNKFDKLIVQYKIDYSNEKRFQDAVNLVQQKQYNAAIYELKALIDEDYNKSKCQELLGDICIKFQNDYAKASRYYKRALKSNPNNVSSAYKLAKIYLRENKNILGIEYLKYTVENTKNPDILNQIEYIIKNKIQPDDKYDANNMYEVLGEIYIRQNKKQDAFNAFRTALKINPNDLYLKYYLGDLYYSVGDSKNASIVYDAILFENPDDFGIRTSRAKSLYKDGDLISADREYRKILVSNPDSVQALYGLYKIYEGKLPPDKILEKIYSSVPDYKATKNEALRFAKILEGTNDSNAVNVFINYARELERIEKEKQEALRKAQEAEKLRLAKIEEEKRQKIELENKRIQEQKDALARKKAQAEALRLKRIEEQKRLARIAQEEKIRQEQIAKEKAKKAQEERIKQAQIAKEKARIAQEEKIKQEQIAKEKARIAREEKIRKEKERQLALQKQQEEKRLEQQRILAEKKAREAQLLAEKKAKEAQMLAEKKAREAQMLAEKKAKEAQLLAEKKAREEQLRLQKEAELARQKELQRQKEEQLALQKQKELQRQKEEKERQEKLLAEKKQKEYEDRVIADETLKAKQKDLTAYNKTMEQIKKYSADNPKTANSYVAIANTYKMNNQPMSAIRNYKEAIKLDPQNSDIYYNLGLSYMEMNSFVTARANLVKAVNLDKDNQKAKNLLAFVNQKITTSVINNAFTKFEKKQYIEAYDILNNGIKDFGDNSQLYYYRALVADAMNRNSAQILDLQKSIELDATNHMAYYQLGKAYEKINDERNALVSYERFLSTEPDEKELVDEVQKKVVKLGEKYY